MDSISKVPLGRGKYAIIDAEDKCLTSKYKWSYNRNNYATASIRKGVNDYSTVYMHRLICGLKRGDGLIVDHINGNGLDNRKSNLRICSKTQNQQNQKPRHTAISKYKGVGFYKRDLKWRARVIHNKKDIELGKFDNEISAALAYDEAAEKYHKEFAWLNRNNFVEVEEEYKRRRM